MIFGGSPKISYDKTDQFDDLVRRGGTQTRFFDDKKDFDSFADNLYGSVEAGTMDPFSAQQYLLSFVDPASGYFRRGSVRQFQDFEVPMDQQLASVDFAARQMLGPNYELDPEQTDRLLADAKALGMTGSRRELLNFNASYFAKQPGANLFKGVTPQEELVEARYGRKNITEDGDQGYLVFGQDRGKYEANDALMADIQQGLRNYTKKMGAYGSLV